MSPSKETSSKKIQENNKKSFYFPYFGFVELFFDYTFQLILTILIFISSPVILSSILPFVIYRTFVKYCAKVFRKDLGNILSPRSSTFAADRITESPKVNIVCALILEGELDLKKLQSDFTTHVINNAPKDGKGVNRRYQRLFQYIVNWGGYYFWKDDNSFDLNNHIKSLPSEAQHTEKDLIALQQLYLGRKWAHKRPLWEFVLVPNYIPSYSTTAGPHVALLFTFHHSMSDLYSFFYFVVNAMAHKESLRNAVPNYVSRPWYSYAIYILTFPFRASWETAGVALHALKPNELYADKPIDVFQLNGPHGSNFNITVTQSLPISLIKDVKSHYKTSFAAVMLSVLAGALSEFYQEKGIHLPRVTPCFTVLAYPGHKLDKFQNHASGAVLNLPTKDTDSVKLLHLTTEEYNRCKRSTLPTFFFYAWGLGGYLISPILRLGWQQRSLPTGVSSFPIGLEHGHILNCRVIDSFGYIGLPDKFGGIAFAPVSYVDRFRVSIVAKPSKFSSDDLKHVSSLIENRFIGLAEMIKFEP